jgi:hypothetical protein
MENMNLSPASLVHYTQRGQTYGPEPFSNVQELAKSGKLDRSRDLIWSEGWPEWISASKIHGLFASPPPPPLNVRSPLMPTQRAVAPAASVSETSYANWLTAFILTSTLFFLGAVLIGMAEAAREPAFAGMGLLALFGGFGCSIWLLVSFCIAVHRMWTVIQGPDCPSPGKAVGLLFVPLFNFYWIFRVYVGWVTEYETRRQRGELGDAPEGNIQLAQFAVLSNLASSVPFVGWVIGLASLILMPMSFKNVVVALNYCAKR